MLEILLIHRSPKERGRLSTLLKRSGFQVISAADRQRGFEKLSNSCPAMIIMADESPDAQKMCADIKKTPDLPILLLGKGDDISRAKMLEIGADMYVSPEISNNELIARIYALLRRCKKPERQKPRNIPISRLMFSEGTINRTPLDCKPSSYPITPEESSSRVRYN